MKREMLFKEINIWKPIDEHSVIRYRCFEILSEGKFFVAQADNFHEDKILPKKNGKALTTISGGAFLRKSLNSWQMRQVKQLKKQLTSTKQILKESMTNLTN